MIVSSMGSKLEITYQNNSLNNNTRLVVVVKFKLFDWSHHSNQQKNTFSSRKWLRTLFNEFRVKFSFVAMVNNFLF